MRTKDLTSEWEYLGDVGSNPTPFDAHSPNKYVTKAQGSAIFPVNASDGSLHFVWLGNQWNSGLSETPPGPRKHDLLYWSLLSFNATGGINQIKYTDTTIFDIMAATPA